MTSPSSHSSWSSVYLSDSDDDSTIALGELFGNESDCSEQAIAAAVPVQPPTTLYLVRMSALRNHDNQAFATAISDKSRRFRAVFFIDPWYTCVEGKKRIGLNRLRFMLESLHDINRQLHSYGTSLYVVRGHPLASLEKVCTMWNVKKLVFQADRDVRSHFVENAVERLARSLNLEVLKYQGHTLYDTEKVLAMQDHPITTMKEFCSILPLLGSPNLPSVTPPPPPQTTPTSSIETDSIGLFDREGEEEYCIPTLSDFGYPSSEALYTNSAWVGGETEALRRLSVYCNQRKEQRELTLEDLIYPTALSPYIRFGCLSVRSFLCRVKELVKLDPMFEDLCKEVTSKLLQREFYFIVSSQVSNFDQYNNSLCLQLPWEKDEILLTSWREGCTGYPWIDASIRQLQREGWIHHCLRESVAIFLTRGDLWQSWVEGKKLFQELLLDFEPGVSSGCWMKSSCSAFITGPVEHYCPVTFGKKIDPHGKFIRRYLPELQNYPDEYIYSPWLAPLSIQIEAGCRVGVDYPAPIIDHRTAGVLCCEKLRSIMSMLQQINSQQLV